MIRCRLSGNLIIPKLVFMLLGIKMSSSFRCHVFPGRVVIVLCIGNTSAIIESVFQCDLDAYIKSCRKECTYMYIQI